MKMEIRYEEKRFGYDVLGIGREGVEEVKERAKYALLFIGIVFIEVLIALYVHDDFVRPYVGDILVVFAVYYFARIFFPKGQRLLPVYVLIFAACVEGLQYFDILYLLRIENNTFLRVLLGSVFDWKDIICYGVGCGILMIWEIITNKSNK